MSIVNREHAIQTVVDHLFHNMPQRELFDHYVDFEDSGSLPVERCLARAKLNIRAEVKRWENETLLRHYYSLTGEKR